MPDRTTAASEVLRAEMKQIYAQKFAVTYSTGDSGYVYSDRVPPGMVLRVRVFLAYAPEREASDDIVMGIENGGEKVIVRASAPLATQKGLANDNPFWVGEGDRLFAYFPDADDTDTLEIHIAGAITTLKEWQES